MSSYQFRISQECVERAIGQTWTFARFTIRVWEALADYGAKRIPNPLKGALEIIEETSQRDASILRNLLIADQVEIENAEKEKRAPQLIAPRYTPLGDVLWDKAYARRTRYLQAQSEELRGLTSSHEGNAYLFFILLKPNHPSITEETAYDIYWDLRTNNGQDSRRTPEQVIEVCNGTAPESLKNASPPEAVPAR